MQLSLRARVVLFLERCKNLDVNLCDCSVLGNGKSASQHCLKKKWTGSTFVQSSAAAAIPHPETLMGR